MSEETLAGYVDVDSGTMLIGDPCYYGIDNPMSDWSSFCDLIAGKQITRIPHVLGHEGRGIVVHAGLGDGTYPVYVTVRNVDGWGERVTEMRIDFMADGDDDE